MNAHLNKFLEKLSELVETKGWSFKDDVQLYIADVDPYMTNHHACTLIEEKGYTYDQEYYYVFYPEEEEMMGKAYDEELERERQREYNRYGQDDRSWSGWSTGATCDV